MKMSFGNYKVTRRTFLRSAATAGLVAAASPLSGLGSFARAAGAGADKPFAVLQKFTGEVFINGEAAGEKQPLAVGDVVRTGKGATAWVLIQGSAITMIKQLSSVKISGSGKNGAATDRGAALALQSGAALSYVHAAGKVSYPYSIKTPTAVAGVRGTTFFIEVLNETRTYVCDCFGNVEVSSLAAPKVVKDIKAVHHTAFTIGLEGSNETELMKPASMIDHTDEEIADMKKIFADATGLKPLKEKQQPPKDDEGFQY